MAIPMLMYMKVKRTALIWNVQDKEFVIEQLVFVLVTLDMKAMLVKEQNVQIPALDMVFVLQQCI